jgi:hypothetical protein
MLSDSGDASLAQRARVIELHVTETFSGASNSENAETATELSDLIKDNYGLLGIAWARHIMKNYRYIQDRVQKEVARLFSNTRSSEDRFYEVMAATVIVAEEEIRKLGWWDSTLDGRALCAAVTNLAIGARNAADRSFEEEIAEYLSNKLDETIVVKPSTANPSGWAVVGEATKKISVRQEIDKDNDNPIYYIPIRSLNSHVNRERYGKKDNVLANINELVQIAKKFQFIKGPNSRKPYMHNVPLSKGVPYKSGNPVQCIAVREIDG